MSSPTPTDGPAAATSGDPPSFTLQIISPSIGVPQPLIIQHVPTATTVKELKGRMRNMLQSHPPDEAQRFIHRGRLLAQELETMETIFGQEAIRGPDPLTLHFVLRDLEHRSAPPAFPTPGAVPPPSAAQQHVHHHQSGLGAGLHNPARMGHAQWPGWPNLTPGQPPAPVLAGAPGQGHVPHLPPGLTPQQYIQQQMQLVDALNSQRRRRDESVNRAQRERATMGLHGISDPQFPGHRSTSGGDTPGRTASPAQPDGSRTTVREGVGPNGQWRITVNESISTAQQRPGRMGSPFSNPNLQNIWRSTNAPPQPRSAPAGQGYTGPDVQNILQQADANQATRTMADAMRRNASTSSLASLSNNHSNQPVPPGVTVPSRGGSAAGTPDPLRAAAHSHSLFANHTQSSTSDSRAPEVYILSSPQGPRALLINNQSEMYFSPQTRAVTQGLSGFAAPQTPSGFPMSNAFTSQFQVNPHQNTPLHRTPGPGTVGNGASGTNTPHPQPQQNQPEAAAGLPHPPRQIQGGNGLARAEQAVRIHQLWPHIWMIIRLGFFIWWFTSPSSSWSRWVTVISIAITLFLANAGLLNPLGEHIWVPLRQHLENLIPLADGQRRGGRAAGDANANNDGPQHDPDPADTAARLVQQRRVENANWVGTQIRRLERAGLLFLASIAPGVAERHIAHLEAEARAERRRQEEAEAAAAAAAAEAQRETEEDEETAVDDSPDSGEYSQPQAQENNGPAEPLAAT